MPSLERRRMPKIAIAAWALAIGALPCVASAAPKSSSADADLERRLVEQIEATQSTDGPYSLDLLKPLAALADIYEASGDHGLALGTLGQALQIVRANHGLFSLDQAPLLRESLRADEAAGETEAAWNVEQDLLALARRNPDDLRAVDIFRDVGDRRMDVLRRYAGGEYPREIVLGCYYSPERRGHYPVTSGFGDATSCTAGSRGVAMRSMLADAWRNYTAAIRVLAMHGQYASPELHALETTLIQAGYDYHVYELGHQSYNRLIAYNAANEASWLDRVTMAVQMADWDLLFGHYSTAVETYEQCYALLEKKQVPAAAIARLFSPDVPVVLPAFESNPLAPPAAHSDAYVDVTFDVDLLGDARRIRVGGSKNASREAQKRVLRLIAVSHFRPRIVSGEIERKAPIALRYYLEPDAP